ncbi:MAG TPA: SDR family NAD(P)-dependent oxidoreductase, partial [Quisquiliibacterium sp.]|nr:SDR family NAD(P)-dependent oxidoreductase [Quisquiliibacterium sp.]
MYQPFDLTGRTAVVTGGNGGIGLGMARALLASGAQVVIWGSNAAKTEAARAQLAAEGGKVHALVCNVGDEAAVDKAFGESVALLGGRVDACFANAGVSSKKPTPLVEMDYEEFRRVQQINVDGVFFTFRAAARHMVKSGTGGSLV